MSEKFSSGTKNPKQTKLGIPWLSPTWLEIVDDVFLVSVDTGVGPVIIIVNNIRVEVKRRLIL